MLAAQRPGSVRGRPDRRRNWLPRGTKSMALGIRLPTGGFGRVFRGRAWRRPGLLVANASFYWVSRAGRIHARNVANTPGRSQIRLSAMFITALVV